jgi:hypothetical protein
MGTMMPDADHGRVLLHHALALVGRGLPGALDRGPVAVLPLAGKAPVTRHGVHDATTDSARIRAALSRRGVTGIGIAVPPWAVVLDVDPRSGGDRTLADLVAEHGPLPTTLTAATGRGDGGQHLWWHRPPGRLTGRHLPGIDVLGDGRYVVSPPSIHPDTDGLYRWVVPAARVSVMTPWLAALVVEPDRPVQAVPRSGGLRVGRLSGPSPVEVINRSVAWGDVLMPHGWVCVRGDGDADGSGWRHPAASSRVSATVRGGRLYCWSPNTPFEASAPGAPRGYSRAEALATLDHQGDLAALVAAVRQTGALA